MAKIGETDELNFDLEDLSELKGASLRWLAPRNIYAQTEGQVKGMFLRFCKGLTSIYAKPLNITNCEILYFMLVEYFTTKKFMVFLDGSTHFHMDGHLWKGNLPIDNHRNTFIRVKYHTQTVQIGMAVFPITASLTITYLSTSEAFNLNLSTSSLDSLAEHLNSDRLFEAQEIFTDIMLNYIDAVLASVISDGYRTKLPQLP